MRRIKRTNEGVVKVTVTWSDHRSECAKCQEVDIDKSATFVCACAEGSPLLMEHLVELRRPEGKRRAKEVLEWAKAAGVFKIPRGA